MNDGSFETVMEEDRLSAGTDGVLGLGGVTKVRSLGLDDIKAIAQGSCFLASGGGGSLRLTLDKIIPAFFDAQTKIRLVGIGDLTWEGDWGAVVAGMGSPLKMFEEPLLVKSAVPVYTKLAEILHAFKAGGDARFASMVSMNFCLPVEIGAVNSIVPMIVADMLPPVIDPCYMPRCVVDADGAGRAVPSLPLTTYARRVPPYPNVLGGRNTNDSESEQFNFSSVGVRDEISLQKACIGLINSGMFGYVSGLSIYAADGPTFRECAPVPGGISDSLAIGKIIESENGRARVEKTVKYINNTMGRFAKEIFCGEVTYMQMATKSLDDGHVMITGRGEFDGEELKLHIENENIWGEIKRNGRSSVYIMGPDSINYLPFEGDAVENSDLWNRYQNGERPLMSIIGVKAAPQVLNKDDLMIAWEKQLQSLDGPQAYGSPWSL